MGEVAVPAGQPVVLDGHLVRLMIEKTHWGEPFNSRMTEIDTVPVVTWWATQRN